MDMLVGYTGFVGSNICSEHEFDWLINSRNIEQAYDRHPELLIYSGVPAEMFIANRFPEKDEQIIKNAQENISRIGASTTVLISTVAVYDRTDGVDEDHQPDMDALTPYGRNRLMLEKWVEENCENHLIVRLPAIFGKNLKKNFLFDYIHYIPAKLTAEKYAGLSACDSLIKENYIDEGNGFYKCGTQDSAVLLSLKESFRKAGFSALNFTDSRSLYQFFDLSYLYRAIVECLDRGIKKINLVTPPVSAAEVYRHLSGSEFSNITGKPPFNYDIRTKYTGNGYIMTRQQELDDISEFVRAELSK